MKQQPVKSLAVLVALTAIFACGKKTPETAANAGGEVAKIAFMAGDVRVMTVQGMKKAALSMGLSNEDRIFTGKKSNAEISISGRGLVKIAPSSSVMLSDLTASSAQVEVNRGSVFIAVEKIDARSQFKVKAPSMVAAVRGTAFVTQVSADSGMVFPYSLKKLTHEPAQVKVSVLSGKVAAKSDEGEEVVLDKKTSLSLAEGEKITVKDIIPLNENALEEMQAMLTLESKDIYSYKSLVRELASAAPDIYKSEKLSDAVEQRKRSAGMKELTPDVPKVKRQKEELGREESPEELRLKPEKSW